MQRQADLTGFLGDVYLYQAGSRILRERLRILSGHSAHGIAYGICGELGPAFAPDIGRGVRAIDAAQHCGDLLNSRRDLAMQLTDAEDVVSPIPPWLTATIYMGWFP